MPHCTCSSLGQLSFCRLLGPISQACTGCECGRRRRRRDRRSTGAARMEIPKLPLGRAGEAGVHWITLHLSSPIEGFGAAVTALDGAFLWALTAVPALVWIAFLAVLAWHAAGRGTAIFAAAGLL